MQAPALYQILEGMLSTTAKSKLGNPQAMTPWLRGLKEIVGFNARFIEDDHVVDVNSSTDVTEDTIQAADTWVYGFMATSINAAATVVQMWDVAAPTPGTTPTGHHGTLQLPLAAASTPVIGGVIWAPYEFFDTTCLISAVAHSDYATDVGANEVVTYVVRRNQ